MASNTTPNGSTVSPVTPASTNTAGKAKRKAPAKAKAPARAKAAPVAVSASQPVEILFTQEPNPYHQPVPPYLWIDFPQQGDRLLGPDYVVRMGVGGADLVQISFDGGSWQNCRLTSGYWWYDWSGITPGKHTLVARMRTADGRWFRTPVRSCDRRP